MKYTINLRSHKLVLFVMSTWCVLFGILTLIFKDKIFSTILNSVSGTFYSRTMMNLSLSLVTLKKIFMVFHLFSNLLSRRARRPTRPGLRPLSLSTPSSTSSTCLTQVSCSTSMRSRSWRRGDLTCSGELYCIMYEL